MMLIRKRYKKLLKARNDRKKRGFCNWCGKHVHKRETLLRMSWNGENDRNLVYFGLDWSYLNAYRAFSYLQAMRNEVPFPDLVGDSGFIPLTCFPFWFISSIFFVGLSVLWFRKVSSLCIWLILDIYWTIKDVIFLEYEDLNEYFLIDPPPFMVS